MSSLPYNIKRNDTDITIKYQRTQESDGAPFDLTGYTATFSVWKKDDKSIKFLNKAATIPIPTQGHLDYDPDVTDFDTAGEYEGEFEVTRTSDGKKFTVPKKGRIAITVEEDINAT